MSTTRHHEFETHQPVMLHVELGRGSLTVTATDTTQSTVAVEGKDCEQVRVEQQGRTISIVAPRQRAGFFSSDHGFDVEVTVPLGSDLAARTGSADITVDGTLGTCEVRSGSGEVRLADVAGPALVETGSGDVRVEVANAELRVKSGSGEVTVGHAEGAVAVSTGSGDVEIRTSNGPAAVKTGSGDFRVVEARDDVSMATGSGDLLVGTAHRGKFTMKGASGDVHIGIPAGTPVWTDLSTLSGTIRSDIEGAGQPAEGADHVELRAKVVSGDIVLTQV